MTHITVLKEITGVPLRTLCWNWNLNSFGIIVNIGGKF
jgi:hypothetical protein